MRIVDQEKEQLSGTTLKLLAFLVFFGPKSCARGVIPTVAVAHSFRVMEESASTLTLGEFGV